MKDHHKTAVQALRFIRAYLRPDSYRVARRIKDVNDLAYLFEHYGLLILDRDCFLQEYHGKERVEKFEGTLRLVAPKTELVSNSSFSEFLKIGDVYSGLFPVSKLVRFLQRGDIPHLLRIRDFELRILSYDQEAHEITDKTDELKNGNGELLDEIIYNYKKPDPLILQAVIDMNIQEKRIVRDSRVAMVGDRYLTDIVAGNLAGVESIISKPYKPFSDKLGLLLTRYLLDTPIGGVMSRLAR
ncbi:HAD hydrolase-like protein [Candidatus Woesearchaeota archaeon]|nr:HAD hydrolase-like protein [Candidatus Woesearchaeota archaeon]